jgi:hypothetical protein
LCHICRSLLTSFPIPGKRKRDENGRRWKRKKEIEGNTRILKVLPFLPPWVMAEEDWTPSSVTSRHQQKLVKHRFMEAEELEAYRVSEEPAFPTHAEGYVVSFMAFYEWGFSMPPHQFLCWLLWYYGLELHHLTPLGVLHIAAFMNLCEAY